MDPTIDCVLCTPSFFLHHSACVLPLLSPEPFVALVFCPDTIFALPDVFHDMYCILWFSFNYCDHPPISEALVDADTWTYIGISGEDNNRNYVYDTVLSK